MKEEEARVRVRVGGTVGGQEAHLDEGRGGQS